MRKRARDGLPKSPMPVYISGANSNDDSARSSIISNSYITYEIRGKDGQVTSRRYTEFEGLQAYLYRTYPKTIIPPIPPKENLTDYLSKYISGKPTESKQKIIQQRIRALQVFLDYIDGHPVLSQDEVYKKFISPDLNWIESSPNTVPPFHPSIAGANPKLSDISKKVFLLQHTLETLEKSQAKLLRGMKEAVKGYEDLGSSFNAFSLENPGLSSGLEACGEEFDEIGGHGHELVSSQSILTETIQLCQQFCGSIQRTIDNNADIQDGEEGSFKEEVKNAIKVIENLLQTTIMSTMRSKNDFYSTASEKFSECKIKY